MFYRISLVKYPRMKEPRATAKRAAVSCLADSLAGHGSSAGKLLMHREFVGHPGVSWRMGYVLQHFSG